MAATTPATYTIDANTLASQWLAALGWPNTAANQKALASWFKAESPHSGNTLTVKGNNPLNITASPMASGYWLAGGGSVKIDTFASPAIGLAAFKQRISLGSHNYPGIVSGFKVGNGQAAITSIINSGWVVGGNGPSYNHSGSNLLQNIYTGSANSPIVLASQPTDNLATQLVNTVFGGQVGQKTWQQAANDAVNAGTISVPNYSLLSDAITKAGVNPTSTITATDLAKVLASAGSVQTGGQTLQGAVGGFGGWVISHAVALGAIIAGGVMAMFGIYLITKEATSGGSAQSLVSPVPVFLREGA